MPTRCSHTPDNCAKRISEFQLRLCLPGLPLGITSFCCFGWQMPNTRGLGRKKKANAHPLDIVAWGLDEKYELTLTFPDHATACK